MPRATLRKQEGQLETLEQVNQYLIDSEQAIALQMLAVVSQIRNQRSLEEIQEILERNALNEFLSSNEQLANAIIAAVINSINNVGQRQAQIIAEATGAPLQFNPAHPRVTSIIEGIRSRILQVFTSEQVSASTQAVVRARGNGESNAMVALIAKLSLGLAVSQAIAVVNYLDMLRNGNREVLDRVNRDPQFDQRIESAFSGGRALTESEITTMLTAYADGLTRFRSEIIGESEGNAALHLAIAESYRQAFDAGLLLDTNVEEVWNTREDSRVRQTHIPMNNQRREPGIPFTSGAGVSLRFPGDPGAPIQEIIRCRCLITREIKNN